MAVVLFFMVLSFVVLAPLTLRLDSSVPAPADEVIDYYHFHWNLWWLRHAVTHGENIWYTDYVLAPFEHNLAYHSLTASLLPVYVVFEPLVGHYRTANGIIWGSMALTGALMFALLRRMEISRGMALLGGAGLAASPYMLHHAGMGHLNLLTVWWLPLALLVWRHTHATGRWRWALLTGGVLWGMWFTDTLIVLWGALLLGPLAVWQLATAPDWAARRRLVLLGGLALALAIALAWALGPLQPTLDFDRDTLRPARLLTLRYYAVPLEALLFQPGAGNRSIGRLPVALVVLAILAGWRQRQAQDRERWLWFGAGALALVLALGPDVDVLGVRIPLPFRIIHAVFDGQMRTPVRFLPPAMAGLVIFTARSLDPWLRRRSQRGQYGVVGLVLLALLVDFGALQPVPLNPKLPEYDLYAMMRAEDEAYVVVDVPAGPSNGWDELGMHPEAMIYGITHQQRMLSGLLSRIPVEQRIYYETSALIGWLAGVRPLDAAAANSELRGMVEQGIWSRGVADGRVGYVVVHQDWIEDQRWQGEILAFLNLHPSLCYITTERDAVLYRGVWHPTGCPDPTPPQPTPGAYTLDFGLPGDEGAIGPGWFWPEPGFPGGSARWTGAYADAAPLPNAEVYTHLPPGRAYTLTLRAVAYQEPRRVQVIAAYEIDGELLQADLGTVTVQPGDWDTYTLPEPVPADMLARTGGSLALALRADGAQPAGERRLTAAYDWLQFQPVPAP